MTVRTTLLLVLLSAGLNGCFGAKKKRLIPVAPPAPVADPETLPRLPNATIPPEVPPEVVMPPPPQPTPPKPVPGKSAPARRAPRATRQPKPYIPAAPEPPPPATPQLGAILPPATERQFRTDLDKMVMSARSAVARAIGRSLTAAQRETVDRIQSFIQQASVARDKDPETALQLARRADLLGQDLLKSLSLR